MMPKCSVRAAGDHEATHEVLINGEWDPFCREHTDEWRPTHKVRPRLLKVSYPEGGGE